MDESFPKSDRLLKRADFVRAQKRGSKHHTKSLLVLVFPNKTGRTRFGIAVSKKFGKSVERNRAKRVLREVFRRNRQLFPKGSDIVVVPKKVRHCLGYSLLVEEIALLARRGSC